MANSIAGLILQFLQETCKRSEKGPKEVIDTAMCTADPEAFAYSCHLEQAIWMHPREAQHYFAELHLVSHLPGVDRPINLK
jgi:hypothetical protein